MTENLRLEFDGTSATGLTVANTNITSAQYNVDTNSDGNNDMLVISATQPYNQPAGDNYYDWGSNDNDFPTAVQSDRWLSRSTKVNGVWATETNPTQNGAPANNLTGDDQKLGIYYNYYTATSGMGTLSMSGQATTDICSANWQLPRAGLASGVVVDRSWANLIYSVYGFTSSTDEKNSGAAYLVRQFPISVPLAGFIGFKSGDIEKQGIYSRIWAASSNGINAFYFNMSGDTVNTTDNFRKLNGHTIRCIAK